MHSLTSVLDLLYPPACLLCHMRLTVRADHPHSVICQGCEDALPRLQAPLCVRCGVGLSAAFDARLCCARCRAHASAFEMARAPWQYAGRLKDAVHQFKYARRWRLGQWLAQEMAKVATTAFPMEDITAILPVPRHRLKRWWTGCSPAEELAWTLSRTLHKPCLPRTLRVGRWIASQTGLRWQERNRNVRGAFTIGQKTSRLRGQRVLLVDDVFTSGSTAQACALALKRAGARTVYVLTAARTPLGSD